MLVSRTEYSAIYAAFLEIEYDTGGINRHNPEPDQFEIPDKWFKNHEYTAEQIDKALRSLSGFSEGEEIQQGDFYIFCCGESSEQERIARRDLTILSAWMLLTDYCNEWEDPANVKPLISFTGTTIRTSDIFSNMIMSFRIV